MYSEIHVNISNILLFTHIITDNIIYNKHISVKLKQNTKQKRFH